MVFYKKLLFFIFVISSLFFVNAQEQSSLYKTITEYYCSEQNPLTIDEVVLKFDANSFTKEAEPKIYKNLDTGTLWVNIALKELKEPRYLYISNAYLSYGKCYIKTPERILSLHQVSYDQNFPYRYVFYRYPTWKIPENLPAHTSVFLELKNDGGRFRTAFHLDNENAFLKRVETEYFMFGMFIMFLVSMTIVLLFFSILKKEYVVLFYAGYILLTVVEFLAGKGIGLQYVWSGSSFLTNSARSFSQVLGTILMGLFYMKFYPFSSDQLRHKNIFKWGVYIIIPFVFLYIYKLFFGGLPILFLSVWVTLRLVIVVWLFNHIYLLVKKMIPLYLVIAFVLPIVAITVNQSTNPSVYSSRFTLFVHANVYYFSLLIEILFFTRYIFRSVIDAQKSFLQLQQLNTNMKLDFQSKTMALIQQERQTIFSDVHDTFGGYLEALKWRLLNRDQDTPEKVQEILTSFYKEYRYLLNSLYAPKINAANFQESLTEFCSRIDSLTESQIYSRLEIDHMRLSEELYVHLYRIVSELLMNAVKYSKASKIEIAIAKENKNSLQLIIQDNGIGFDIKNVRNEAYGLKNVQERVKLISGEYTLLSNANQGTTVTIVIPIYDV